MKNPISSFSFFTHCLYAMLRAPNDLTTPYFSTFWKINFYTLPHSASETYCYLLTYPWGLSKSVKHFTGDTWLPNFFFQFPPHLLSSYGKYLNYENQLSSCSGSVNCSKSGNHNLKMLQVNGKICHWPETQQAWNATRWMRRIWNKRLKGLKWKNNDREKQPLYSLGLPGAKNTGHLEWNLLGDFSKFKTNWDSKEAL